MALFYAAFSTCIGVYTCTLFGSMRPGDIFCPIMYVDQAPNLSETPWVIIVLTRGNEKLHGWNI